MVEETTSKVKSTVSEIRRRTCKKYWAEEKAWIVLEGLRGESTVDELCRREGIHASMYYNWGKEFLEAGKQQLGNLKPRQGWHLTTKEVEELRKPFWEPTSF